MTQDGEADWQELLRELAMPDPRGAGGGRRNPRRPAAQAAARPTLDDDDATADQRRGSTRSTSCSTSRCGRTCRATAATSTCVGLEGNKLTVHYQGACGSCPSSLSGTLAGIEGLIQSVDPDLQVAPV